MKIFILAITVLILTISEAYPVELSLKDCISMALGNNRGLKVFKTEISASEEDIKISRTGFLPSLKLTGNYSALDKSDMFLVEKNAFAPGLPAKNAELLSGNREMYGLSFNVEQPLFTGGRLTHTFIKSKILNEESRYNEERQTMLLIFDVKKAYYDAVKERLNREIIEKVIESRRERLRVLKELFQEGYVEQEEILLMETDLSSSELDLYKIKNREELALSRLKRLTYYEGGDEMILTEKPANGYFLATLEEIKDIALTSREDIKMSAMRIKAAEESIKIAKSGFYPKATIGGSYTAQRETNVTRPEVWMLSAQIEWQLFEWGRTRSEANKAAALRNRAQYEHEERMKAVALEAEGAWRDVKEKQKEVEFYEKKLKTAEYRLRRTIEKYAEKVIKLIDLLEMETGLIKAYNEYISSINDLNIYIAFLEASASAFDARWLSPKDIYSPDFDSLSNAVNSLLAKDNKGAAVEREMHLDPPQEGEKIVTPEPEVEEPAAPGPVNADIKETMSVRALYSIQVNSYKSKENAEKTMTELAKKVGDKEIKIYKKEEFYKVRITWFNDKEDARGFSESLGIRNYLIVRSVNGD